MSILGEHEADAFFHEGDSGTYEGGPVSLAPVSGADLLIDEEEHHATLLASPEQLARRERFKRLVTTGMTTLAACSALVFALRGTKTDSATASAASPSTEQARPAARPVEVVRAPVVAKAAPVADAPLIDAPPLPPIEAAPVVEHARVAPSSTVAPVAKTTVTSNAMRTVERASAHRESVSSRAETASAAPPAVLGRPTVVMMATSRSTTSGHAPPTATFPD